MAIAEGGGLETGESVSVQIARKERIKHITPAFEAKLKSVGINPETVEKKGYLGEEKKRVHQGLEQRAAEEGVKSPDHLFSSLLYNYEEMGRLGDLSSRRALYEAIKMFHRQYEGKLNNKSEEMYGKISADVSTSDFSMPYSFKAPVLRENKPEETRNVLKKLIRRFQKKV